MNAPSFFQFFMHDVFRDFLDSFLDLYLDNLLMYSETEDEHMDHLMLVLGRISEHGVAGNLENCAFKVRHVDFLGHVISPSGCSMEISTVQSIIDWQPPTTVVDIRRFLRFANYHLCSIVVSHSSQIGKLGQSTFRLIPRTYPSEVAWIP